jgi:hypothetical protein
MVAFDQPHHAVQWCLLVQVRQRLVQHQIDAPCYAHCVSALLNLPSPSLRLASLTGPDAAACVSIVGRRLAANTATLHWLCLLFSCKQEALLYEPWEAAVLRHPGFEPVTCPDSGRLLFAGPRLRMGLAEGAPHSVAPDHSGRANYAVSDIGWCMQHQARMQLCR